MSRVDVPEPGEARPVPGDVAQIPNKEGVARVTLLEPARADKVPLERVGERDPVEIVGVEVEVVLEERTRGVHDRVKGGVPPVGAGKGGGIVHERDHLRSRVPGEVSRGDSG